MFKRSLSEKIIQQLLESDLYRKQLSKDITEAEGEGEGDVFPGIRNERIDFYHKGGKLFSFKDGQFRTHIKFASVYQCEKDYVTEEELSKAEKCNFGKDYSRIKENCAMFAGQEAFGVSQLYSQYSYVKMSPDAIMVLDIEVSLKSDEEDRVQDRIDLLLFNNGKLRFYEAKHFSNSEIWARLGSKPKVVNQAKRYQEQIRSKEKNIIEQYKNYVEIVNKVFNLKLNPPQEVDPNVPVLVFGFDRDQQKGRLNELFKKKLEEHMISYYPIGDVSKINLNHMWAKCE